MDIEYYKRYEPIDGKWYITRELGRGAFGVVFEVERRDFTDSKSALKIITIPSSQAEVSSYREENYELDEQSISSYFYSFVEEFMKEFQLMSVLKGSANIVTIEDYDVIKHADEIGWDILIRMELLTPMNRYFADKPISRQDAIRLGIDICKALEDCKEVNVIHRDIKPSNIFVSNKGVFKLGDFGVARTLEKTSSGLSKKGTYIYMAPEVFKGDEYNSTIDIYSLGIVLYKLLNNNLEPFRTEKTAADGEKALARRFRGEPMPAPANADEALSAIILKACAFNPRDRFSSPSDMRRALEAELSAESYVPEAEEVFEKEVEYKPVSTIEFDDYGNKTTGIFDAPPADNGESEATEFVLDNTLQDGRGVVEDAFSVESEGATVGLFSEYDTAESSTATNTLILPRNEQDENVGDESAEYISDSYTKIVRRMVWIVIAVFTILASILFLNGGTEYLNQHGILNQYGTSSSDEVDTSDMEDILAKGELVIGYTDFNPMNYHDENNNLVGFDTEYAMAVCEKLGVVPTFVEINWDEKEVELNTKNIDCIWNGFNITEERRENVEFTNPYMQIYEVDSNTYSEYGVGFRKDSDMAQKVNEITKELFADGTMESIADKYCIPHENLIYPYLY